MGMYGREKNGPRKGTDIPGGEVSMTKQSFRDEVNINKIIAGFEKTGMVHHLNSKVPFYGDVSDIKTYQESLEIVNKAEELFNGMDASVRERFMNDPVKMVEFLEDPANLEEAISLGMAVKRPETGLPDPIDSTVDPDPVPDNTVLISDVKRSDATFNKGGSVTIKKVGSRDAKFK